MFVQPRHERVLVVGIAADQDPVGQNVGHVSLLDSVRFDVSGAARSTHLGLLPHAYAITSQARIFPTIRLSKAHLPGMAMTAHAHAGPIHVRR